MTAEQGRPKLIFDYQQFDDQCAAIIAEGKQNTPLIKFVQKVALGMRTHPQWPIPIRDLPALLVWQDVGLERVEVVSLVDTLVTTHGTVSSSIGREGEPVINEIRTLAVASLIGSLQTAFPRQENVFLGDLVSQTRIFVNPLPLVDHMRTPIESKNQQYDKISNPFSARGRYSDKQNS